MPHMAAKFALNNLYCNISAAYTEVRPKKNNCLVVLHNFFWEGAGGQIFFFFQIKVKATWNYSLYISQ